MNKVQRYQIKITRQENGNWHVLGYWESSVPDGKGTKVWDLDGDVLIFKTRKEALEFCMNVEGIPE